MEFGDEKLWEEMKRRLYKAKEKYEKQGYEGIPMLELLILPLIDRFESGERSSDVHAMILDLD